MNMVLVELTGADIAKFLTKLNTYGIPVYEISGIDSLSVKAKIPMHNIRTIQKLAEKSGVIIKIYKYSNEIKTIIRILKRPVLIFSIMMVWIITLYLPTKILQIEVEGNQSISDRYILEAAQQCGIVFGANRSEVRSEVVKNRLLELLPQLQWAGVNTYGSRAVISVTEKTLPEKDNNNMRVSSMIACTDGVIESITTTRGNALCAAGQAVSKGQVLISGYLDCGNMIKATEAEGEIYARTKHHLTVLFPQDFTQKPPSDTEIKKYSIIFGKNRINLSKDSGISTDGCVKMYKEYLLTLPGGIVIPVSLAVECWKGYNKQDDSMPINVTSLDLADFGMDYLSQQMISGTIISREERVDQTDNGICLKGEYNCLEMIGRVRTEEIIDGKDH